MDLLHGRDSSAETSRYADLSGAYFGGETPQLRCCLHWHPAEGIGRILWRQEGVVRRPGTATVWHSGGVDGENGRRAIIVLSCVKMLFSDLGNGKNSKE